jgi:hypothetical protein
MLIITIPSPTIKTIILIPKQQLEVTFGQLVTTLTLNDIGGDKIWPYSALSTMVMMLCNSCAIYLHTPINTQPI